MAAADAEAASTSITVDEEENPNTIPQKVEATSDDISVSEVSVGIEKEMKALTLLSPPEVPNLMSVVVDIKPRIVLNAYSVFMIRSALMKGRSGLTIGGSRVTLHVINRIGDGEVGNETELKFQDDALEVTNGKRKETEGDYVTNNRLERVKNVLPSSFVIHGLPGSGKTHLLNACETLFPGRRVVRCRGSDFVAQVVGEGERKVREVFSGEGKLILVDDIDVVAGDRKNNEWRGICSEILSSIDGYEGDDVAKIDGDDIKNVVIATCGSLKDLDPAITRAGRLSGLVECSWGDSERWECLLSLLKEYEVCVEEENTDSFQEEVRRGMAGWVGADIVGMVKRVKREEGHIREPMLRKQFMAYVKDTSPTTMRSETVEVEKISWDNIGGMSTVKKTIRRMVTGRVENRALYQKYGVRETRGVLMYGPPGCSKTLIAKALATECGGGFLLVKGPEVLGKYLGESENRIKAIFDVARKAGNCVIFFDEFDSIASRRAGGKGGSDRVLSQLLAEVDGCGTHPGVVVVGATNRPDLIDEAMTRPGRIDGMVYVPPPDEDSRRSILKLEMRGVPIEGTVDYNALAKITGGMSGAEVVGVVREGKLRAIEANRQGVAMEDLVEGASDIKLAITTEMLSFYEGFERRGG